MLPLPPSLSRPDKESVAPLSRRDALFLRVREAIPRFSGRMGWTLYTVVSCLFFLLLTFPTDLLLQRIVRGATRETPIRVQYARGELTWWGRCRLREVKVAYKTSPAVNMAQLTMQPSLVGLLFGRPWPLAFTASLFGGTVRGSMTVDASGHRVQVAAQRLDLRMLPLTGIIKTGEIQGLLSGEGEVRGNGADLFSWQGQVALTVSEGALRAGSISGISALPLSSVETQLRATMKNGLVEIADFTLQADNAEARVHGSMIMVNPLQMSTLNLQLTAKAPDNAAAPLKMLISLLPTAPDATGMRRASISGSLAAPVLR